MRILGIDIGTVNLGFAVLELSNKELIHSSTVKLDNKTSLGDRLVKLESIFKTYIDKNKVNGVIIEKPNIPKVNLYYPCGLFCYLSAKSKLEYQEVGPTQVKKLVCGNGKATKEELEDSIRLSVNNIPSVFSSNHESDSVGIALCWKI
jgi:Holliday junction resolvasome RuvABC endonuclease subunit